MMTAIADAKKRFDPFPRAPLGFFPTPFYKLERLSKELAVNLYIKRDDFTGPNLFGGNKVRKLTYLLGQAVADQCEYAVTYGATQSNHAMETAACCRRMGLKPILYLTAVVPPDENDVRANLLLDKILDAEIHIVDIREGETEHDADARALAMGTARAEELTASGHPCINIPMGGAAPLGSLGFAMGYLELMEQCDAMALVPDVIFHATGTGGTLAGLAAGKKLLGRPMSICSVTASNKDASYLYSVEALANEVLDLLGADCRIDRYLDLCVDNGYYLPGYEQPSDAASDAIRLLAKTEGIFIDPVYTGKAFAGMLDYIYSGRVEEGANVVFWHTGGATALFAEQAILGRLY